MLGCGSSLNIFALFVILIFFNFLQARGKSPMVSKMEKSLSARMEKAGLIQINIWKVKEGRGEESEILKQIERTTMLTRTEFTSTYV